MDGSGKVWCLCIVCVCTAAYAADDGQPLWPGGLRSRFRANRRTVVLAWRVPDRPARATSAAPMKRAPFGELVMRALRALTAWAASWACAAGSLWKHNKSATLPQAINLQLPHKQSICHPPTSYVLPSHKISAASYVIYTRVHVCVYIYITKYIHKLTPLLPTSTKINRK